MKVLIVDDSEPIRRLIKTYLADLVEQSFECGDGSEALAAYRTHQPDLVLMDLKMNKVDGLEATHQIRPNSPKVRIVIVSMGRSAAPQCRFFSWCRSLRRQN